MTGILLFISWTIHTSLKQPSLPYNRHPKTHIGSKRIPKSTHGPEDHDSPHQPPYIKTLLKYIHFSLKTTTQRLSSNLVQYYRPLFSMHKKVEARDGQHKEGARSYSI